MDYELTDGVLSVNPGFIGTITAEYEFTTNPTREIDFEYDHNGLRTRKKVVENGVTTTYDYTLHGKLITHLTKRVVEESGAETTESLHFFYDAQSRPAFLEYEGAMYRYIHNLQGDIVAIVDSAGNKVVEYKYDAWGKPVSITGSLTNTLGDLNPFRYRGYVYDEGVGLYFLRSRYYNPEWDRFINSDTVLGEVGALGSHNLFAYCRNNPVMMTDPDGLEAVVASGSFWSGAIVAGTTGAQIGGVWGFIIGAGAYLLVKGGIYAYDALTASSATSTSTKSTTAPTVSPSPSATPAPKTTLNPDKKYYIAIAYGSASPVPVSPALTSNEAYDQLHVANAAANVQKYVSSGPYSNITNYVYGVYTPSSTDARNLAKRFGDPNPRLDLADGLKMQHYNVTTPGYTDIHFWFFN